MANTRNQSKQRVPSRLEKDAAPKPYNSDSIALRRIIADRGYWLTPFMRGAPVPVLTEWEWNVDLVALERHKQGRPPKAALPPKVG